MTSKEINKKPQRNSSFELLRIVAMVLIVLHHYCVCSGFMPLIDPGDLTFNAVMLQFLSIGGKIGVNIFFLISGYFMIESSMKWDRVIKLIFQIFSINVIVFIFLTFTGTHYGIKDYMHMVPFIFDAPTSFITNYMMVYLLSPLINKSLKAFTQKEFRYLLVVLVVYFSVLATFLMQKTWSYFAWAFTVYCIGAYIRLYKVDKKRLPYGWLSIASVVLIWAMILGIDYACQKIGGLSPTIWTYVMTDANKLTVLVSAIFIFMYFARLKMSHIGLVNALGGSVAFGVQLWHSTNQHLRDFLWGDLLHTTDHFNDPSLWLHALLSVIGIYIVCSILELARQKFIEEPVLKYWGRKRKSSLGRNT